MVKVGCISDTHVSDRVHKLDERILDTFREENVRLILHAGDFTSVSVLDRLNEVAPTKAVLGNMDHAHEIHLPEKDILKIKDFRILLFHGKGVMPTGDILQLVNKTKEEDCNAIVTGHTHIQYFGEHKGIKIINPGSTADAKYGNGTFMILDIGEEIDARVFNNLNP